MTELSARYKLLAAGKTGENVSKPVRWIAKSTAGKTVGGELGNNGCSHMTKITEYSVATDWVTSRLDYK